MTYIHNHAELKDEILRLRAERRNAPGPRHRVRREVSPALTLEEENRRLRRQVAELEARVQDLRAVLWGGVRP